MDKFLKDKKKHLHSEEARQEAQVAIMDEVRRHKLEFAELSPIIRDLLASVYIRGGLEMYRKVKIEMYDLARPDNQKSA